jgi:hypothetical protein
MKRYRERLTPSAEHLLSFQYIYFKERAGVVKTPRGPRRPSWLPASRPVAPAPRRSIVPPLHEMIHPFFE